MGQRRIPVSRFGASDVALMLGLRLPDRCENLAEEIYVIRSRRDLHHPLVMQSLAAVQT